MNIVILAAGASDSQNSQSHYHPLLTELVDGLLIERLVASCEAMSPQRIVFAMQETDVRRYHLDDVIELLSPRASVAAIKAPTAGAACTALLFACDFPADEELLVLAATDILDTELAPIAAEFRARDLDAGTVVFPSVHPRYSYVRLSADDLVIEASEKRPISRNATAGFYWFRRTSHFVESAQSMLRKGAHVDGNYFVCPTFNEMVLRQAKIGVHRITADRYRPVKSVQQHDVIEMESRVDRKVGVSA